MATFPKQQSLPTAVTSRTTLPLYDKHQTTTNFMEIGVAKIMEMMPKCSIDMDMRSFARFDTMKSPTEGDAVVNSRAYFVPFRTIMRAFEDFDNDVSHVDNNGNIGFVNEVHSVYNATLAVLFSFYSLPNGDGYIDNPLIESWTRYELDEPSDTFDNYDIVAYSHTPGDVTEDFIAAVNLNDKGARFLKILHQLGYQINFSEMGLANDDYYSIMPLLALVKIYLDHYYPSQYANSEEYQTISSILTYDDNTIEMRHWLTPMAIYKLLDVIDKVSYNNDYFVSAWDNPVAPTDGAYSNVRMLDVTQLGSASQTTIDSFNSSNSGTPQITTFGGEVNKLSQYALNALKSLSDYMTRHNIVGARVIDRYLSRWGVKLQSAKLNLSVYIDDFQQNVLFGDVTSTADTEGANLGAYAGKGILPEKTCNFSYETDERGYLIILSTVNPVVGYYQGVDPLCSRLSRFDFFTPEFDNLGVEALPTRQLYMPMNFLKQYADNMYDGQVASYRNSIFGFLPRYASYKVGNDKLTGDYRLGSRNTGLDSWHLFRNLDDFFYKTSLIDISHDINFVRGNDSEQYNRIFNYYGDGADKIKISHYFNYRLSIPGKPLYDTYEFTDEDKAEKVTVDVGGSKAN